MIVYDNKKFIILQEDDKGFSFKNKKPSGYTKIEIKESKFRIFYYIQNLNNENIYSLSLIIKNESKIEIISIGDVKPDENGKIDVSYEFDDALLECLHGSTVCFKDLKGEVKYPLSGFLAKKKVFNWKINQFRLIKNRAFRKENFIFDTKKDIQNNKENRKDYVDVFECSKNENKNDINKIVKVYEEIEVDSLDKNDDKINEFKCECNEGDLEIFKFNRGDFIMDRYLKTHSLDLTRKFENKNDNIYCKYENEIKKSIDKSKDIFNEAKSHIDSLKKLMLEDDGEIKKMIKNLFSNFYEVNRSIDYDYDYKFFLNILSEHEEFYSLNQDNYRFFKVYVDNFSQMENIRKIDNIKYAIIYYPMVFMYPYFIDRGYFIIGINCDGKDVSNLVYGVEADFDNNYKLPYDGETGFNKHIYDYENSKKYIIMEYDYKRSEVK